MKIAQMPKSIIEYVLTELIYQTYIFIHCEIGQSIPKQMFTQSHVSLSTADHCS